MSYLITTFTFLLPSVVSSLKFLTVRGLLAIHKLNDLRLGIVDSIILQILQGRVSWVWRFGVCVILRRLSCFTSSPATSYRLFPQCITPVRRLEIIVRSCWTSLPKFLRTTLLKVSIINILPLSTWGIFDALSLICKDQLVVTSSRRFAFN